MKLDSQGSQFNPDVSQRLKHVPDVLFVDEDGNPIEAGHENIIYVDENGNEIPEEIAQQLLESGKYIDSRDMYADSSNVGTASMGATSGVGMGSTGSGGQATLGPHESQQATSYDLTQASLPASAFGSLSKSTGANQMHHQSEIMRKSTNTTTGLQTTATGNTSTVGANGAGGLTSAASSQAAFYQSKSQVELEGGSTLDLLEAQAKIFAQAQAKMKQREEELALIEADANRESKLENLVPPSANSTVNGNTRTKSASNTEMQKSHSGRRLLQPPPLKTTANNNNMESALKRQQQSQQSAASVVSGNTSSQDKDTTNSQHVYDLYQLITAAKQEQAAKQQQQHRDNNIDEVRVRSRQGRSSRKSKLNQTQSTTHDEYENPDCVGGSGEYDETGELVTNEDDVQSQLTEQHILEMREQQMLREKLLRKQQEYLEQQQQYSRRQQQQQYDAQSAGGGGEYEEEEDEDDGGGEEEDDDDEEEEEEETAGEQEITDDEYYRQMGISRNLTQSVGSTNINSPRMTTNSSSSAAIISGAGGAHHHHYISSSNTNTNTTTHQRRSTGSSTTMGGVGLTTTNTTTTQFPSSLSSVTRDKLKDYLKDFRVEQIKQVGSLSGKNVIYNLSKIDLSEFDRFYAMQAGQQDETLSTTATTSTALNEDASLFIDPYDPNLFKDEIVDIDFGAIDAYTAGLNSQINSLDNAGNHKSSGLQFPSHILTSNHATFIDNQMLLGDAFYQGQNNGQAAATTNAATESVAAAQSTHQFYSEDLNQSHFNESFGGIYATSGNVSEAAVAAAVAAADAEAEAAAGEYDAADEQAAYSPSNSFGSMVDIQSQQTYSVGDINTATTASTATNNNNYASYFPQQQQQQQQHHQQYNYTESANYSTTTQSNNAYNSLAKMKNSLTNSAIYNVNNYVSR